MVCFRWPMGQNARQNATRIIGIGCATAGLWTSGVALAGPGTIMVGYEASADRENIVARLKDDGATAIRCYSVARLCRADFSTATDAHTWTLRAATWPGVRWTEQDAPMNTLPMGLSDDYVGTTDCPALWELPAIGLGSLHDEGWTGTHAPVVAVADSGFLTTHRDFGNVAGAYDYGDRDSIPEVTPGSGIPHHGTFIAGELVAVPDNGVGRAGVMADGSLYLAKIADRSGALYFSYAVDALADIADGSPGARIVSYSLGGSSTTTALSDAVAALGSADILLVAAAANCSVPECSDGNNDLYPIFPANEPGDHILAVAGSRSDGSLNPYSHYGFTTVDLAAPGVDICSLGVASSSEVLTASGTSYATPIAAGIAALLWEAHPDLTAPEVRRVLLASVTPHADLATRVVSGGNLNGDSAVHTPVPRLAALAAEWSFTDEATLDIPLENVGDDGVAHIVLTHPDGVRVFADAPGWTAETTPAGTGFELPDTDETTLSVAVSRLTGPVDAHSTPSIPTRWVADQSVSGTATLRVLFIADAGHFLGAPTESDDSDETGHPAYRMALDATATDRPTDTDAPHDSASPDTPTDDDSAAPKTETATSDDPADKSGCSTLSAFPGLAAALVGLVAVFSRRRESPDVP